MSLETNITCHANLHAKGCQLLAAAYEFWREHQKIGGTGGAVVWLSDGDGKLVVFTRAEYRDVIMRNIEYLRQEIPLDDGPTEEAGAREDFRKQVEAEANQTRKE